MNLFFPVLFLACVFGALAPATSAASQAPPEDSRRKLVMLIAENEYETARTLPRFAETSLKDTFRVVIVSGSVDPSSMAFDRIEEIADADVLLVSVRRRTPPQAQLDAIKRHVQAGKPVVGIRTASHAFVLSKGAPAAPGNGDWPQWDATVIGGHYVSHYGSGSITRVAPADASHPILRGVALPFESTSSLYQAAPLREGAQPLLMGIIPGRPAEPVAWTFTHVGGGRTFYTSLGGPNDFQNPSFARLLRNGILWAAGTLDTKAP